MDKLNVKNLDVPNAWKLQLNNVSVFISYSWDSETHQKWVLKLAHKIELLGIKVIIDKDNDGSVSLVRFMEDGVANNRYVICVCSDGYLEKEIPGHRRGIHVELDEIERRKKKEPSASFVILVVKNNTADSNNKIPSCIEGPKYFDFDQDGQCGEHFFGLIKRLYSIDSRTETLMPIDIFKKHCYMQELCETIKKYWYTESSSQEEFICLHDLQSRFMEFDKHVVPITSDTLDSINVKGDDMISTSAQCIQKMQLYTDEDMDVLGSILGGWNENCRGDSNIISKILGDE